MKKQIAGLALIVGVASTIHALDIHVSPQGNDQWSGLLARPNAAKTDGPVATLTGARDALRKIRQNNALKQAAQVLVQNGIYHFSAPLILEPQDSGTADAPIVYQAAPNATPLFSGGRTISGFKKSQDGLWTVFVPDVADGKWYFEQLFVNDKRAIRARTPNKFFYYIADVSEEVLDGPGRKPKSARQTIITRPDDFQTLRNISSDDLKDINLVVYHNWDNTRRFIDKLDLTQNAIITSGEGMKSWNPWRKNSHYILENFRAALDEPGEWFLARNGMLYYKPLPGESISNARVYAPVADKFVVLKGDASAGNYVEHVHLKNLRFQHGQWLTPPGGFEPAQAAAPIEAALMADGARNIILENCEFGHLGTYVAWFRRGCFDSTIRHCHLYDFGAGGVRIGETGIAPNAADRTARITVDNNIIRHGGYIFPCAVGVWIGHSPDNTVTHNEIADLYYTGISAGWRWGYGESLAKRNLIAFNHVHHIGWGLTSDMGGIYTLGPSEGTIVRNNIFHDIYAYSYGGWGLYTDEGSTGILMENNLVYDVKTGGFHQHYGKENIVRNNILAFSKVHQIQATRVENHLSFSFTNNIVLWDSGPLLNGPWDKVQYVSGNNCFWNNAAKPVDFKGKSLKEWQAQGHESGSIIADPLFAGPSKRDFRIAATSPALALGFKPWDYAQSGVYGERNWIKLASSAKYPPLEIAPSPSPIPIHDTFEKTANGKTPVGIEVHVENKGDSISISNEKAAQGSHSLKVEDAPGLKAAYNPHLVYPVKFSQGSVENSFDLYITEGTHIQFEWRDWSDGDYKSGPAFSIKAGEIKFAGKTATLPYEQWFHITITSDLAGTSQKAWSLSLNVPGKLPQKFDSLLYGSPKFSNLTWVGFCSMANEKTAFYLDNLKLENKGLK